MVGGHCTNPPPGYWSMVLFCRPASPPSPNNHHCHCHHHHHNIHLVRLRHLPPHLQQLTNPPPSTTPPQNIRQLPVRPGRMIETGDRIRIATPDPVHFPLPARLLIEMRAMLSQLWQFVEVGVQRDARAARMRARTEDIEDNVGATWGAAGFSLSLVFYYAKRDNRERAKDIMEALSGESSASDFLQRYSKANC